MRTYKETLAFLFNQLPMYQRVGKAAYKADLFTTQKLDAYFGFPHRSYKTIHVAGTNGKGSVSHGLASVLQEAGYKVGLYTSPHLKDFRERIKVNGEMISEDAVVQFVNQHSAIISELEPSFFEMTVAMAFNHFKNEKVDIAVVEVGMGGRLDSTNVIRPEISVITNIGLDHTAFLGNTLEKVAREKAGIIKANVPVIVGQTQKETSSVFKTIARDNDAEIIFADQVFEIPYSTLSMDERQVFQVHKGGNVVYEDLKLDLLGSYQIKNAITIIACLERLLSLGFKINKSHVYDGLNRVTDNTGLLGRWQYLGYNPRVVCDTGHNTDGIKEVVKQIDNTPHQSLYFILGMVDDKDHSAILSLLPKNAKYLFTKAAIPRSMAAEKLKILAAEHGLEGEVFINPQTALERARKMASANDLIFIGGSTFVVADVL